MTKKITNQFLLYKHNDKDIRVDVRFDIDKETIWLSQKQIAELFEVEIPAINKHISNIINENELKSEATISKMEIVQQEGSRQVKRNIDFYNLDMIIAVGYRVNSKKATAFRIWSTNILKEYMIKGFVLDNERLKGNSIIFDKDYFDELLERIRSIRASERRIYQKITDIFAECSIDYDSQSQTTKDFYTTIQNKFHFAIHGQTASERIYNISDKNKKNMGLTTWKHSPKGRILKSDVVIAKNYLSEDEIKKLERTISSFFDYIENLIEKRNTFDMENFVESVNKFLEFNEFKVLKNAGKISYAQAEKKAFEEYEEFNKVQKIESDFDKKIKKNINNDPFHSDENQARLSRAVKRMNKTGGTVHKLTEIE